MKTIIISAADEKFSGLLIDLLNSLFQWGEPLSDAIGILDLGLSNSTKNSIKEKVTYFTVPDWDLPLDNYVKSERTFERAKLSRPFLPKYFPGYDLYLWLDADTWVQERFVIDYFFQAAKNGELAICISADRCYNLSKETLMWRQSYLHKYFGVEGLKLYRSAMLNTSRYSYYNDGAFCLEKNAPHWNSWAKYFKQGLERYPLGVSDQAALNFAIWKDSLAVYPLSSLCNWACHLALPLLNPKTGKLCEPLIPFRPIGLIHMTANTKDLEIKRKPPLKNYSLRYLSAFQSILKK
jgi:lipopolysaccharide biosynthesis glycosyltransferase